MSSGASAACRSSGRRPRRTRCRVARHGAAVARTRRAVAYNLDRQRTRQLFEARARSGLRPGRIPRRPARGGGVTTVSRRHRPLPLAGQRGRSGRRPLRQRERRRMPGRATEERRPLSQPVTRGSNSRSSSPRGSAAPCGSTPPLNRPSVPQAPSPPALADARLTPGGRTRRAETPLPSLVSAPPPCAGRRTAQLDARVTRAASAASPLMAAAPPRLAPQPPAGTAYPVA